MVINSNSLADLEGKSKGFFEKTEKVIKEVYIRYITDSCNRRIFNV